MTNEGVAYATTCGLRSSGTKSSPAPAELSVSKWGLYTAVGLHF